MAKLDVVETRSQVPKETEIDKSKLVAFFPGIVYDLTQLVFFPINYAIGGLCYLQPKKSVWNEPDFRSQELPGSGAALDDVKAQILGHADVAYNEEDLVKLYDALPSVDSADLTNRSWRGKILRTNASVLDLAEWIFIRPLNLLGINWGKRYRNAEKGDPLLFRFMDKVYVPVPLWGNVGMTGIEWRGETTATMNYDHQPWKDYFKLLSNENGETVLLGVWTHKHIAGGWFTLTLDPTTKTN